jgi:hypothetical protein
MLGKSVVQVHLKNPLFKYGPKFERFFIMG